MDFGKLADISQVNFKLSEDKPQTISLLQKSNESESLQVWVGCPVWSNKNWVGKIYPPKAKEKDFLTHYARQFNTIELNVTHYQIPSLETIQKWQNAVNPSFKFCPKWPQIISHDLLLNGDYQAQSELFCQSILGLGDNLGTSFLQLPPHFSPRDIDKLVDFISFIPQEISLAFEFRHPDWFKEANFEGIAKLLENQGIGTVMTDVAGRRDVLHLRLTKNEMMLRFVGNDLHPTDYQRVDEWVQRIKIWLEAGLKTIYFFAHEPNNDDAPDLAKYFIDKLNQVCHLNLSPPKSYLIAKQGTLF
jgi:uncharacterized protein YecE (DUF72 family)